MLKISHDTPASRGSAVCRADQELALLRENVLPNGYMRRVHHPVAAVEAAHGLVESLAAATAIRCQAPAMPGGAYVEVSSASFLRVATVPRRCFTRNALIGPAAPPTIMAYVIVSARE